MNGTSYSNFDNQEHVLKLGETFEKHPKSAYHTVRYDFKPASIDTTCEGELEVGKGEQVTITLPNLEGSSAPVTVFKGSKRPYMKECILIVNHDTGEYRLEKLSSNIAVKKTRAEGSSKIQSRLEQQTSRLTQMRNNKPSSSSKSPPNKGKTSPTSPMDDIERELMAEAQGMDQLSSSDSSSNGSSSSSSDDSSSSDSEDEQKNPLLLLRCLLLRSAPGRTGHSGHTGRVPEHAPPQPTQQQASGELRGQHQHSEKRPAAQRIRHRTRALHNAPEVSDRLWTLSASRERALAPGVKLCALGLVPLRQHTSTAASTTVLENSSKLKTVDDLTGPSFMTTLNWLFVKGYFQHAHQLQVEHSKIWGPMWKSTFGPLRLVNVSSAELIEQVLRQEGRHPVRTDMPHWRSYRELRNKAYGPFTEMGVKWQRIRSILNPRMLKPKHVTYYTETVNEVVTDFLNKLSRLRGTTGGQPTVVRNLADELYRLLLKVVIIFPRSVWPYLPFYKKFVATWDHLFKVAEELIQKKMDDLEKKVHLDQNIDGAYLTHLLLSEKMTVEEILGSATELLLAGVDTTMFHLCHYAASYDERTFPSPHKFLPQRWLRDSEDKTHMHSFGSIPFGFGVRACLGRRVAELEMYLLLTRLIQRFELRPDPAGAEVTPITRTVLCPEKPIHLQFLDRTPETSNTICWALYHLAREPEIQEQLYQEVNRVCPGGRIPTREDTANMPFMKAIVRETLRPCSTCVTTPPPTTSAPSPAPTSSAAALAPRLRRQDHMHSFGSIRLGSGCGRAGRRVAELEMYLLLTRLIQRFELRPDPAGAEVTPITRTVLCPEKPIHLQFLDRTPEAQRSSAAI
ncbi:hypothetical protein WMY93_028847 [Mugilogobius chulae]|uniref:Transcription elongation factor Eaf N-terminal domain-containing protein n=1 Tax=Mugilogobius chulae TaxID=88201 RepID=A0AAW0MW79_9GOBI